MLLSVAAAKLRISLMQVAINALDIYSVIVKKLQALTMTGHSCKHFYNCMQLRRQLRDL